MTKEFIFELKNGQRLSGMDSGATNNEQPSTKNEFPIND